MIEICYKRSRQDNVEAMLQHSKGLELCSSQPARDWKSCAFYFFIFYFDHHFLDWKLSFPFYPGWVFHCLFICFSPLWHFHFSSLCFENGPWSLGIATRAFSRTLFVSFHSVSFLYCLGYFSFLCLENCPWKLSKGAFSRTLLVFFRFFVSFWLCFPPLPWKLTLEIIKRSFSSNPFRFFPCFFHFCFRFFYPLFFFVLFRFLVHSRFFLSCFMFILFFFGFGYLSSFAIKIDLGNSQKELFLEPFSCFFRCFFLFWLFVPLCLQDWPWKLSKGAFSRTLLFFSTRFFPFFSFVFSFVFSFFSFSFSFSFFFFVFFHFVFHFHFYACLFSLSFLFSFLWVC